MITMIIIIIKMTMTMLPPPTTLDAGMLRPSSGQPEWAASPPRVAALSAQAGAAPVSATETMRCPNDDVSVRSLASSLFHSLAGWERKLAVDIAMTLTYDPTWA